MTNKTSKIGQDLLVNILSTLPPKSLMRFKCVAKWWHALINDPRFVDKHLSHSLLDDQSTRVLLKRMLVPSTEDPNGDKFQSVFSVLTFDNVIVDDDDGGVHKCSTLSGIEDVNIPLSMSLEIGDDQSFHVIGHCDGIICLARPNSTKVLLWNPAIQEFRVLPSETYSPDWFDEASFRDPHPWWLDMPYMPLTNRFNDVLGLGYDPKSKDYKVVKIGFSGSELHGGTEHLIIHPPKVVVYTLGTNSWREIEPYSLFRGFHAARGIRVLVDMSLISIDSTWKNSPWKIVQMHDLVQEMGRTIVLEQCFEDPGKRSRLFKNKDVNRVLQNNTGTPIVQAMWVDRSKIEKQRLKRADFKVMSNLMMLTVVNYGTYLAASLDLPSSLRYLEWHGYPLNSLPSKFCPENLVELHMPRSRVKKLWNEDQRLVNLKVIDLTYSSNLTEVPNLSGSPEIEHINLHTCENLVKIPGCFQHLDKLTYLNLGDCTSLKYIPEMPKNVEFLDLHGSGLQELPNSVWSLEKISYLDIKFCMCEVRSIEGFELPRGISKLPLVDRKNLVSLPTDIRKLKSLKKLKLSWCSELENFQEIFEPKKPSESMKPSEPKKPSGHLNLRCTAIRELLSSIEFLPALKSIRLSDCSRLSRISESIPKLKYRDTLDLKGGSAFYKFLQISKRIEHLNFLSLEGTAVKKLHSSIENLIGLETLDLGKCWRLSVVPGSIYSLTNLKTLSFRDCSALKEWPSGSVRLQSLEVLDLHRTSISEIPDGLVGSTSLQKLDLSGSMIRSIPASIKQASRLHTLSLGWCEQLQSLPELPVQCDLEAQGCRSLKTVPSSRTALTQGWDKYTYFGKRNFFNCGNLDDNARSNIMDEAQLRIMREATNSSKKDYGIVCPGKEIPKWFSFRYQSEGSSVHIKLPPDCFRTGLLGFVLSAVVSCVSNGNNDFEITARCNVKSPGESHGLFTSGFIVERFRWIPPWVQANQHDHVCVWGRPFIIEEGAEECSPDVYKLANEASVQFSVSGRDFWSPDPSLKVENCGIWPLYAEDVEKVKPDRFFTSGEPKIQEETREDETWEASGSSYKNKANESDDESEASKSSDEPQLYDSGNDSEASE